MSKEIYIEPINISRTKKILEQMSNCVCKINLNDDIEGTGFFCKVNSMNFLMTCYNLIDEKYLKENKELNILLNNDEEQIKINLEIKRENSYFNKENNTTFIELKEEDNIKNYLELDDNIFNEKENYKNKSIYLLQYLYKKEIHVSYGYINEINDKKEIKYICYTDKGSIGSPILNIKNNKVIGIHTGIFNYGILLKYLLIDYKRKKYKIIKELGHGGFGKVNKILNILDNKYYAMKEISLQGETINIP